MGQALMLAVSSSSEVVMKRDMIAIGTVVRTAGGNIGRVKRLYRDETDHILYADLVMYTGPNIDTVVTEIPVDFLTRED